MHRNAAYALGWLGEPRAAAGLLAVLAGMSLSPLAVGALARLRDPRLSDVLMDAFQDDSVGSTTASALGEPGDPEVVLGGGEGQFLWGRSVAVCPSLEPRLVSLPLTLYTGGDDGI
jgi:hypothetical protein